MNKDKHIPLFLMPEQAEWLYRLLHEFEDQTTEYTDEAMASVIAGKIDYALAEISWESGAPTKSRRYATPITAYILLNPLTQRRQRYKTV